MSKWHKGPVSIPITEAEAKSGFDRVRWAESLIVLLPSEHEGRNSWLLNFGVGEEAVEIRAAWETKHGKIFSHDPKA